MALATTSRAGAGVPIRNACQKHSPSDDVPLPSSKMKTIFAVLAFVLLQHAPILQAQQVAKPQTKHCLWKVQDRTNAIHLLGSIHFLKKEFYPLPKPIEDAYAQ